MAILGTDLLLVGRGSTNYKITASALAAFIGGGGGGGVTSVTGSAPIVIAGTASVPDITISGATAAAAGAIQIATVAEATAGTNALKALTPETGVPKDAPGMAGAAILPGSAAAYAGTPAMGMLRYNDTTPPAVLEYYDGSGWVSLSSTTGTITSITVDGTNGITVNGTAGGVTITSSGTATIDFPIDSLGTLP